ncbi:uncharacterized protein BDZ99DRAFT_568261 [Mytilinidion resinicola]|uniref:Uncharacterized protein n=1 Tax=Mytilinidion resinicola TaxID=574789 RepID=A0A6A6YVL4_9PEZI|nr:uncharacterized protein BDZ99DRAFT_568261 [Mytilinidion resinicola]KAF2812996.1 hypothetical protein BDZ99DRAFT_568261 [Mytilinidion resinicola]
MGVTLSTNSALAPISFASTVIGFISFAFTLATFLNVFWSNLLTFFSAPTEIHDYLSNLKQGLYEERTHLRRARRRDRRKSVGSRTREKDAGIRSFTRGHSQDEDVALRVMRETIKHMIRQFRALERPFLRDRAGLAREEKGYADEDEVEWPDYYRTDYRECGFRERFVWLRRKNDVVNLLEGLARVETRRIAKEVGDVAMMVRDLGRDLADMHDSVYGLEQRLSRVVGIRRVD